MNIITSTVALQNQAKQYLAEDKAKVYELLKEAHTVSFAAKAVGVNQEDIYKWRNADPEFDAACGFAMLQVAGDYYESNLRKQSNSGNVTATIVGLKMKGRFIEHTRVTSESVDLRLVADLRKSHTVDELRVMLKTAEADALKAQLAVAEGRNEETDPI